MKWHKILLLKVIYVCTLSITAQNSQQPSGGNGEAPFNEVFPMNGNGSLGNIYNVSKCGLNYVQTSRKVTDRNSTGGAGSGLPCTLTISGLPASCIVIEQAYLWYEESYNISPNTSSPANPAITVTNPSSSVFNYVGTVVGMAGPKQWNEDGTRTFRIDVTNAITGNGNYIINTTSYANEIDGMTLFIIYSDYNATYQGSLLINDGIITGCGGFMASQITGFNACANSTSAKAFGILGDAQYAPGSPNQTHESILNNSPSTPYSDAFWNFDQMNTSVGVGQTSSSFGITPGSTVILGIGTVDCISWIVEGLYYQTTTCATCPTPLVLNMSSTSGCGCNSSATVAPSGVPGAYTYSWAPSGGNAATANNLCPGTYTVTVTAANGCVTNTSTVTIVGNPTPTPTANNTGPYCAGETIQLNSPTGSGTDDWAGPGGYTSTNTQNPVITNSTPAMSGVYTVTVTNGFGCSATATTTVVVNPAPVPIANNTGPYCTGQNIQLNSPSGSGTDDWAGPGGYTSTNTQNPVIANATTSMSGIYTVTVTNAFGCSATATTNVVVNAAPVATATNTGPYCVGATISLTSSGGTGYSWTGPLGFSSAIQNPNIPSATVGMSGVYTVVVTGAGGCTSSATTTVVVNSGASATASNTGPYCEGASISLNSGAGGINYDWVGPAGYTITNTQNPIIPNSTVAMNGVYTVTVTVAGGCTGTATTTVVVNANPVSTATNTGPYCSGETIQLNSSGGTGYSWTGPLGYTNGTQNPTIPMATTGMAGIYTVVVTNAAGCTSSSTTTVNVSGSLVVSAGSDSPVCDGTSLNFTSTFVPGGNYVWVGPSGFNSSIQNPSINPVNMSNVGTYTVTITNPSGCSGTATVNTIVDPLPVAVSSNTSPYCEGATIQLNSNGGASYSWSGPSGYSNGNQNPSIPNSTPAMSGIYTVSVTSSAGCTSSSTTTVTINALPIATANNTGPYCVGATIQLNSPTGFPTDDWVGPGGYAANNIQNPTIPGATLAMNGVYTVTVTNASNCSATATTSVVVVTSASTTANNSGPYCEGATIYLSSPNGAIDYDWTGPGGYVQNDTQNPAIANSTVAMGGTYTVTITIAGGCTGTATTNVTVNPLPVPTATNSGPYCAGSNIQLNSPTGNASDDWLGPVGYTSTNTQNPVIVNATSAMSGSYTVTVTDLNGCSGTATTNVVVNNLPLATAGNNTPICESGTINLNSGGGINYDWIGPNGFVANGNQNPSIINSTVSNSGIYTVTVTDANGCSSTATTDVVVNTNLVFTASSNSPICDGDQLNLSAQNISGAIYDWSGPNGYIANNQQNPIVASAGTAAAGTYTVMATSSAGCSGTATVNVIVNSLPTPNFSADVVNGCVPLCVNFTDMSSSAGSSIVAWNWNIESQPVSNSQNVNDCFNTPGLYDAGLSVVDANGCTATVTFANYINASSNPVASFTYSPNEILVENPTIHFTNTSQGGTNFLWNFGDGNTSTEQDPTHTYAVADTFCVLLTVTNSGGCMDTANICLPFTPDFSFYIPNSFTPNQDETNNVFTVYGLGIRSLMVRIFDRWGREIYNFTNINDGWNGNTEDGNLCQVGVYVYRVEVTDVSGRWHEYMGQVNLIR